MLRTGEQEELRPLFLGELPGDDRRRRAVQLPVDHPQLGSALLVAGKGVVLCQILTKGFGELQGAVVVGEHTVPFLVEGHPTLRPDLPGQLGHINGRRAQKRLAALVSLRCQVKHGHVCAKAGTKVADLGVRRQFDDPLFRRLIAVDAALDGEAVPIKRAVPVGREIEAVEAHARFFQPQIHKFRRKSFLGAAKAMRHDNDGLFPVYPIPSGNWKAISAGQQFFVHIRSS